MSMSHPCAAQVLGNVEKLRKNGCPGTPIHKGVLLDIDNHNVNHPDSTTQAFVWLKRILRFTAGFFHNLCTRPDLELNACLVKAYEIYLGPHHNVVMRQVAIVLMQIIPDRAAMLACFGVQDFDVQLKPLLQKWEDTALLVIAKIDAFYVANNLPV